MINDEIFVKTHRACQVKGRTKLPAEQSNTCLLFVTDNRVFQVKSNWRSNEMNDL